MFYSDAINELYFLWKFAPLVFVGLLTYAFISSKNHINQNHKEVISFYCVKLLLGITVSILLLPLIPLLYIIAFLYRKHVDNYLSKKFKKSYGGLLKGTDSVWAFEKNSKSIINVILIIEYTNQTRSLKETLIEFLRQKIDSKKKESVKLLSTWERNESYYYTLKNQVTVEECVREIQTEKNDIQTMSRKELRDYVSKISAEDLPKKHKALWEVNVGSKPVAYWSENDKNYYPVVFRFHHSLLDGSTFLKFFVSFLGEDKRFLDINQNISNGKTSSPIILKTKDVSQIFVYYLDQLKESLRTASEFLRHVIWFLPHLLTMASRRDDNNILNKENCVTSQGELVWFSEKDSRIVEMMKKTKNKLKGITFSDVISTAITNGLESYFMKNSKVLPTQLTVGIACIPPIPELRHITPGKYDVDKVTFENNFSLVVQQLPIPSMTKSRTGKYQVDKLLQMSENSTRVKDSVESRSNFWIMSFLGKYVPAPILTKWIDWVLRSTTVSMSNLQGPKSFKLSEEMIVKDLVFWVPRQLNTGVGFSILTYENRLQMGLIVDKSLIESPQVVECILEDTINQIEVLYKAVEEY